MKKFISILLLFLFFQLCKAQEIGENQLGTWYMYSGEHHFNELFHMQTALQLWDYEPASNFNLFLVLAGVGYEIMPKVTATIGYGYATIDRSFENLPFEHRLREHRLYEQVGFKNTMWKLKVSHRYRMEHRFLDDTNSSTIRHRNRYRLQVTLPVTDTFFINVYDEIFWHFERDLFDQNRLYGALGICMTSNSKLQLGYLKHHFSSKSYDRLQVSIAIKTNLRRHKKKKVSSVNPTASLPENEMTSD